MGIVEWEDMLNLASHSEVMSRAGVERPSPSPRRPIRVARAGRTGSAAMEIIKENTSAAVINNNNVVAINDEVEGAVANETIKIEAISSEAVNTRAEKAEVGAIKTESEASIIKTETNTVRACPIRALKIMPSSTSIRRARNRALELSRLKGLS